MSVHYKFKSALEYDTVTFDGLHISVKDLKNAIIQQKRIGKNTDFDLQVTNAQTKEVYEDENVLIPKNTSLLIARIPTAAQTKSKQWEGYGGDSTPPMKLDEVGPIAKAVDLSSLDAPEDDKIKAMISQSTQDYDPSNYMKIRGANQMGAVPPNYRCYKCHQTGHWIKDCPLSKGPEPIEIKKSTGIPLSFMVPVEGPQVQGAMMTPNGSYAVPVLDHQTYTQKQTAPAPPPVQELKPEIPEDLLCSICSDLLTDAVMIPCCGNSFCDECIRSFLLESEEHECPDCHEKDISPATLIPNRFLRNSVANFKNTTGYVKKPVYKQTRVEDLPEVKVKEAKVQPEPKVEEEKTVISEADSTEHSKNEEKGEVKRSPKVEPETIPEGPPGVSPAESPKTQSITKRVNSSRERSNTSRQHRHRSRDESPRRHHRNHRNSPYRDSGRSEERAGTPTVDEPGVAPTANYPPPEVRPYNAPPMMGMVPPMQGPPPNFPPGYTNPPAPMGAFPPTNGPPPNFRLPPPGAAPPYMPPGPYQVPPRPIFDTSRPPMTGPPPMYNPSYQSSRSHHRDYGMSDRRMRGRTPSGRNYRVIDDPLAAFNRMLREKDERERRAKRRRSYSRSRSRSRSYSRSPRRLRSRSPRRRSRSRSFSISRHRFKDSHQFRDRDYDDNDRDRDYGRDDRGYSRDREHRGREDRDRDRDRDYYYDNYDERSRGKGWGQPRGPPPPTQAETYYQNEMQYPPPTNRYPPRDYPPPYAKEPHVMPPAMIPPRRYDDVAPPGVEEPPVPGLENTRFEDRFERFPSPKKEEGKKEKKRHEARSRSPEKKRSPEVRRKSKSKDKDSPDKHKKKKRDASSDRDKKTTSDEEKSKKSKDRKKKKEKKDSDKKRRKEKKEKHKEKRHKEEAKDEAPHKEEDEEEEKKGRSPDANDENKEEPKTDLYDDMLAEGVDTNVIESYGKMEESSVEREESFEEKAPERTSEEREVHKEYEDSEKDILEIHPDIDLKTDLDVKNEMLAHLPEKSKWEVEDDVLLHSQTSPKEVGRNEAKSDKLGKVTNEVLKRAENAIFAKAINAIRPIEIKKISTDRAKLYSGEKEEDEKDEDVEIKSVVNIEDKSDRKKIEAPSQPPVRLSVKERLGIKIDDMDRIVKVDRNKSRSVSPFSRRANEIARNYGVGERRVEVVDKRRRERSRHRDRRDFRREDVSRRDRRDRNDSRRKDDRRRDRSKSKPKSGQEDEKKEKRKRSKSRSDSEDRKDKRRKKDKKVKKDKTKKKDDEEKKEEPKIDEAQKTRTVPEKRKPTIDEANFEPDYDLESESEKEEKKEKKLEEKKSSSSSDSSDSTSDDDKKRKKHKKHRKKKSRKDSSSSSSDSESDSSDDDKERKRKKHKKKQKKRKKSKHK
ncbi:E3 ubiquitin-protein ligase RBBP6 isoform X3 [Tribolium castaneum]|uniref:E3 ubiquitin-protein ligase RBBP6 isoform X3 n=1 Tax=Tribolium castaneum TaxID=7070 RepID=UPI00077DE74B|nr:PREDICTED: E3 ubiquitin-protein ligase RBBP6 isoform X3 [Tribolium castaneum]|eukprot:XP_015838060.1 PREDICTED: E3 ubiquitin-protein ligase RBBP6 isoform X3 [Tribolium castaneum]